MEFKKLITYEKTLKILLENIFELGNERVKLEHSLSRVLAEDVKAPMDSPPFNRSAMDGYALRAKDTLDASEFEPREFRVIDEIDAGWVSKKIVKSGECVQVMTGAKLPKGADCVVMQEFTKRSEEKLKVFKSLAFSENVSNKGEDLRKGDVILKKGRILQPQDLSILKSVGLKTILLKKIPTISVIITGSELTGDPDDLEDGKILESNSLLLSSLLEKMGIKSPLTIVVEDDEEMISKALNKARKISDLILITGGSSVGRRDLVPRLLENILFHGVAIKPGKPFGFALDEKPTFIMSGYPVALMIQFYVFVLPTLEKMFGTSFLKRFKGKLSSSVKGTLGRRDFLRVKFEDGVEPLKLKGSGIIRSVTLSDGFIVIPENVEGFSGGEKVEVFLWL
ncbi:MAG: gephyrin-like molybdotransferase Glp [Candidatus Methanofastidiosia archaeon]